MIECGTEIVQSIACYYRKYRWYQFWIWHRDLDSIPRVDLMRLWL